MLPLMMLAIMPVLGRSGFGASGSLPTVNLSATNLSFGYVTVGVTSPPRVVSLKNASNEELSIASIAITGPNVSSRIRRIE